MLKQLPNILTLGRFFLTVIFLAMVLISRKISPENYTLFIDSAFVLFIIAGITDLIDGPIARKMQVTSKFGRIVDPLADKILVCGAFVCFAIIGQPELFGWSDSVQAIIQWGFAAIIILREAYVTILRHIAESKGVNFAAVFSGKLKMLVQSFAIGTVMVKMGHVQTAQWGYWFTTITYIVTIIITVVSGLHATQRKSWQQVLKH
ncbi:MAG: CDP-alcohol phosphatidyltransferase family protein [Phycisphaerae bacterium]